METSRILPLSYNVSTFGNGTRDYQSLAVWESATDNDLVTATKGEVLDCHADASSYDQEATLSGSTVDVNYFRVVRAASGQEWAGDLAAGFQLIRAESGGTATLVISEDFACIYNIVVELVANSASNTRRAIVLGNNGNVAVVGCAIKCTNAGAGAGYGIWGGQSGATHFIINNLIYKSKTVGANIYQADGIYFYNNTVVYNGTNGVLVNDKVDLINNIIQNNGSQPISGTPRTDITNVIAGAVFVDADNDDYLLSTNDSAAKGRGTDLSSDANFPFDDDLLEQTRVDPWTIGMHDLLLDPSTTVLDNLSPNSDIVKCGISEAITEAGNIDAGTLIREYIVKGHRFRSKQTGSITKIDLYTHTVTNVTGIYFKVWRKDSSGLYDLVGTSENVLSQCAATTTNVITFSSPVAGVQEGDYYGLQVTTSELVINLFGSSGAYASTSLYFKNSAAGATDQDVEGTWSSSASDAIPINMYMQAPVFVGIGDSIVAGHLSHYSFLETTETTDLFFPIHPRLQALLNSGYSWQNTGDGSDTTTVIAGRIVADLSSLKPRFAILNGGVNDIALGVINKATFLANWTTILDACQSNNIIPIVMFIAPWTNGTNGEMQTRDDWNADLITLVALYTNSVIVNLDTAVGLFRAGGDTGNLWDIQPAYDQDGIHFTSAGMQAITQAIYEQLVIADISFGSYAVELVAVELAAVELAAVELVPVLDI